MRSRATTIVGALVVVAVMATAWLVIPWGGDDGSRTDRVVEVYARQMGLSPDEGKVVRDKALDAAEVICSTAPEHLDELVGGHENSIAAAIDMAEAGCPQVAADFKAAYPDAP